MAYAKTRLAIALGSARSDAALVRLGGKLRAPKLLASAQTGVPIGRLAEDDAPALGEVFRQLAKSLPTAAKRADVPLFVSLPEALVREALLHFKEFPKSHREAQELVLARVRRDASDEDFDPLCSFERLDDSDGVVIRARSIDRARRDRVEQAACSAGFHISRLEGWIGFLRPAFAQIVKDGACLQSDGASWSLSCWSHDKQHSFSDSGWLDHGDEHLQAKWHRLMQSFQLRHSLPPLTLLILSPSELLPSVIPETVGETLPNDPRIGPADLQARGVAIWG